MNFIWFLIIGLIAGWAGGQIMRGRGFGIGGNIIVGIIGAFIGGFVLDLIGYTTYGLIGSLIMAIVGAVILLFIVNMFRFGEARVEDKH
ncbi:transglycosylase [Desulfuribacillus stibiiarsenatis]|uniref:Transglycosylase n=1 Tax=Desulfuribacillus stibiiarsenatis TaxID=1390249 RepID=A0A1E5L9T3_9FIRM|nr:GlsB/YeaQ/YmgE family stress response membrane protein [Desulfuribacillus stibiiarsenatis]OEH86905.1 transglycosylase [Desulfuribacillus stibiiarsenatis]